MSWESIDRDHVIRQRDWSLKVFGPGPRTLGIINHIRKELGEIEDDPTDLMEWVDVITLAIDGAWRAGYEPEQVIAAVRHKQTINLARKFPDWRDFSQDEPIEHDRSTDTHGDQT